MKKILLLALALAVAFSFLGANSVRSIFQSVPVTVAQPGAVRSVAQVAPSVPVNTTNRAIATLTPTPTQIPTLTPTAAEHIDPTAPAATVVAAESITKAATPTVEQMLLEKFIQSVID